MSCFKKIIFILCVLGFISAQAQQKDDDLIQFSGIVISADSLRALPLVSIRVKTTGKGTYSDPGGFFSFVARKSDTILFSSIGMKSVEYVIPENLHGHRYSVIQPMAEDTFYLPETIIHAWPSVEEFNYVFVKARIPNESLGRARYNTRRDALAEVAAGMSNDGKESYNTLMGGQYHRYYYNGQLPPQRLFDPFAWNEFFNSWKRGDFKKK